MFLKLHQHTGTQRLNIQLKLREFALRTLVGILFVLLVGIVICAPVEAQTDDPLARIDAVLTSASKRNIFSGTVLIARDGEIIFQEGYGYAVREWDVPNTTDSVFLIASVTKQFTAMAILMLQEQGLLTVQDPICQYLAPCPEAWTDITIRQLLTHTSGIPDYFAPQIFEENVVASLTPEEIIAWFADEPLDFAPGTNWSYSNSGYIVLGQIIETVSGNTYATFLRENIFRPLGMNHTGVINPTRVVDHRAEGYASATQRASYFNPSILYAAGGLYSTVGDLYRWDQALYTGKVISPETWDAMGADTYVLPYGAHYAYGLSFDTLNNHAVIGHGGTINGFTSRYVHFPDDNVTIIVLENFDIENNDSYTYLGLITGILFGD